MTPVLDPRLAKAVRLVSLDVDGVLTDGSIWIGADAVGRTEMRRFHALDGMAIRLMQRAGLVVAFVSGKRSTAVGLRARELGIEEVSLGAPEGKIAVLRGILARRDWTFAHAAHLGDDLADLSVMERVGLPAAVVGAVPEVRAAAAWVGTVAAGEGAVREFAEALLAGRGEWDGLVAEFREGGRFAVRVRDARGR
ncbi:KdsC family phosphatase [Candidatus Palauibacter sp.]|uniref:KdsC family phosphatase n=1 Tax=Candidatus Palauibacter sp. TaxID=3101350 RepID=UPI003C6FC675